VADVLSLLSQRTVAGFGDVDPWVAVAALGEIAETINWWGGWCAGPLEDPAVIAALRPMAARVARSAGCRWWGAGIDRRAQQYVQWPDDDYEPEAFRAAEVLRLVSAEAIESERGTSRYLHLPAGEGPGGHWWSNPWPCVISTTRRLPGLAAVLLAGREDGFGEREAGVRPAAVAAKARVYEIAEPATWQRLVTRYPRTATATRRHNWAWTGWDGEWLLPDWPAVAADWDGVHLSVTGYLSTAGRLLPVGPARTLLAKWNPDETYWLADVITLGAPQAWHSPSGGPLGWTMRKPLS
jgi:hypothetical protein